MVWRSITIPTQIFLSIQKSFPQRRITSLRETSCRVLPLASRDAGMEALHTSALQQTRSVSGRDYYVSPTDRLWSAERLGSSLGVLRATEGGKERCNGDHS